MIDTTTMRGPLGWSLLSVTFIVVFGVYACTTILSPIFTSSGNAEATSQAATLVAKHDANIAIDIARFNGRSAFFQPIRKAPKYIPPPLPPKDKEIEEPVIVQPVIPSTYMGPPLIAIIGDEAWFRGPGTGIKAVIRVQIGEESDGITLIGTAEPSIVTVQYGGGEYEIELFSSDEPFFTEDRPAEVQPSFLDEVESDGNESTSP